MAPVAFAGVKGRRIRELTSVVQKRFKFPEGTVELYAEKVNNRGLCAIAQAESLRYKLLGGLAVRRWAFAAAKHLRCSCVATLACTRGLVDTACRHCSAAADSPLWRRPFPSPCRGAKGGCVHVHHRRQSCAGTMLAEQCLL